LVLVALAMYGFFGIIQSNIELAAARAEVARLAAESERSRIARDLHSCGTRARAGV
jgi:two-component system sensor histidine kinase DesK